MMRCVLLVWPAVLASGESWRLFTSLLLHGGITHLALDTLFLGFMGPGEKRPHPPGRFQLASGTRCSNQVAPGYYLHPRGMPSETAPGRGIRTPGSPALLLLQGTRGRLPTACSQQNLSTSTC